MVFTAGARCTAAPHRDEGNKMSETYYCGWRDPGGTAYVRCGDGVTKGRRLRMRTDLDNHSPTGFEWGYGGSGPAQLALAILADALQDDKRAVRLHQQFKFKVIASLPRDAMWKLTRQQVLDHVAQIEAQEMQPC